MIEGFRVKTAKIRKAMHNESDLQAEAKQALQEAYEQLPTEHLTRPHEWYQLLC